MKIRHFLLLAAFLMPLSLIGQSVVGQWTSQVPIDDQGTLGDVLLAISDDGTFTVDFGIDGNININGAYELDGDQITIWEVSNDGTHGCEIGAKGVYAYTVSDTGMDMKRISDPCPKRGGPEGMSWTRK